MPSALDAGTDAVAAVDVPWVVYLIECAGGRFYCGVTNDLASRFAAHCAGRGARFTKAFAPKRIVAASQLASRSAALKAEYALKRQPRARKLGFLASCGMPLDPVQWAAAAGHPSDDA